MPYGDGPSGVFNQPNAEPRLGQVNEGEGGVVIGGPECKQGRNGNLLTWYVITDSGLQGWMSEGYSTNEVPWILPIP